ncbi:DNA-formamidopyrimidine glycosylase family protein [Agreia bicolorata]|uniref:DNA-(apurinic or apyrimidinic site) lyase n=1 Tax=Agreia bicolorata TaxID=110935 RepID=A0ABR5CHE0_9MICO|nr:DNA-formamidopyrimidine glycosylase family protein [Agreia bicolorata]KJC65093.1 DNA glycosylase [Agreia bicolorata]
MPEGDTVYRTARHLDAALTGQTLLVSDFRVPRYAEIDLSGSSIDGVISVGKHLLTRVGEVSIHSHLKMEGSWHLYRPGSRWKRPASTARLILTTENWVAVGFDLGTIDVVARDDEASVVGHLGPDVLAPDWSSASEARAATLMTASPDKEIHVALLDQRNLAGLGNVYANELCFLRGVLPTRPVSSVDLPPLIALAHRAILVNRDRTERSTTGDLRAGRQSWVYRRENQPCRRCGTRIRAGKLGADELTLRDVYWCPRCQT